MNTQIANRCRLQIATLADIRNRSSNESGEPAYRSVATLDENPRGLTCSALAVTAFAPQAELIPCASFEDAAKLTRNGKASAFAVPGAYPQICELLQDDSIKVATVFLFGIPALVLASAKRAFPGKVARLFHHPATTPLLPKAKVHPDELVPMSSNTTAAARAVETSGFCITNAACAAHFGLRIHQVLRRPRLMPFVVFVAA